METAHATSADILSAANAELSLRSLWIVAAICAFAVAGSFWRMRGGFGPQNLRAIGIVFVGSLVAILSLSRLNDLSTSMGIFGTIAGYLFGSQREKEGDKEVNTGIQASGATIGAGSKVAGRDINEVLNQVSGDIAELKDSVVHMASGTSSKRANEYLFVSHYDEDGEPISGIADDIGKLSSEGWSLISICNSYEHRGLVAVFSRSDEALIDTITAKVFHGLEMTQLY